MADRRQEILDAALALADERGLQAVSMRAVAERIGVTPMALYPQVGSKAELLDGMVGRLLTELVPAAGEDGAAASEPAPATGPDPAPASGPGPAAATQPGAAPATEPGAAPAAGGQDWPQRLRALAHAFRKLGHGHPWAAALLFTRPSITPDAARTVDLVYTALLDAGVPAPQVPRVERLVSTLIIGYVASEVGGRFGPGDSRARRGLATAVRAKALPAHAALARWLEAPVDWDAEFEADLDDLLGIVNRAAGGPAGPAGPAA
jgi:AcrR family transcriptional regulator